MRASFSIPVDPKVIRINRRYADIRHTPKPIKEAQELITRHAKEYREEHGINIDPRARLRVVFTYTMNDLRADVDGPTKRALDGVSKGLGFIDGHADIVEARRKMDPITYEPILGPGMIDVYVETLTYHDNVDVEPVEEGAGWGVMPGQNVVEWEK